MSQKSLGINMVNLYCEMVDEEFAPIIAILEKRTEELRPLLKVQVKKELGVYDKIAKKAALELQIKELEDEISDILGKKWNGFKGYSTVIDDEVNRRLADLNTPLVEITEKKRQIKNEIKLCGASKEVATVFSTLKTDLVSLIVSAKELPPIKTALGLENGEFKQIEKLADEEKKS